MLLFYGIHNQKEMWSVDEPNSSVFTRIYYVLSGTARYICSGQEIFLKKGCLYLFPACSPYQIVSDPKKPLECIYLHVDLPHIGMKSLISLDLSERTEIQHLIHVICDAVMGNYPRDYLEMLTQTLEYQLRIKNIFPSIDPDTDRYLHAIRSTYRSNLPVSQVAAEMGYSCAYFIRTFKKKIGISPWKYAISLRMNDAVQMLAGDQTVEEIGVAVGYTDGHSFSNAFRNYYGVSPEMYRKNYSSEVA